MRLVLGLALLAAILGGLRVDPRPSFIRGGGGLPGSIHQAGAAACPPNPNPAIPAHSLTLPDGPRLCSGDLPVPWHDLVVDLPIVGRRRGGNPALAVASVVGNHAAVVHQQPVLTPVGPAILVVAERTPPAAAGVRTVTREYWLIVFRDDPHRPDMTLAYAIQAVVTGDALRAWVDLLAAARGWQVGVPTITSAPAGQPSSAGTRRQSGSPQRAAQPAS